MFPKIQLLISHIVWLDPFWMCSEQQIYVLLSVCGRKYSFSFGQQNIKFFAQLWAKIQG